MVLRIPRLHVVDGRSIDVVAEHNRVVRAQGSVAIAKHGRPPAKDRAALLRSQILEKVATYLYIVCRREDGGFDVFRSRLSGILSPADHAAWDRAPKPAYYSRLVLRPTVLFLASEELSPDRLDHLTIDSSQNLLSDTIRRCSTSLFTVYESGNT